MVGANCMGGSNPDSPKELDEKVVVSILEITTHHLYYKKLFCFKQGAVSGQAKLLPMQATSETRVSVCSVLFKAREIL